MSEGLSPVGGSCDAMPFSGGADHPASFTIEGTRARINALSSERNPLQGGNNAGDGDTIPTNTTSQPTLKRRGRPKTSDAYEKAKMAVTCEEVKRRGPAGNDLAVLTEKLTVWDLYLKGHGVTEISKKLGLQISWVSVLCKQALEELRMNGETKLEERRDRSVSVLRKLQLEAWELFSWKKDVACLSEIRQAEMNIAKLYGLLVDKIGNPDGSPIKFNIVVREDADGNG